MGHLEKVVGGVMSKIDLFCVKSMNS